MLLTQVPTSSYSCTGKREECMMTEVLQYRVDNEIEVSSSIPEDIAQLVRERSVSPYSVASEVAVIGALDRGWSYGLEISKVDQDEVLRIARVVCLAERVREILEARGVTFDELTPSEARTIMRDTYPVDVDFNHVLNTVDQSARAAMRHVVAVRAHNANIADQRAAQAAAASESEATAV